MSEIYDYAREAIIPKAPVARLLPALVPVHAAQFHADGSVDIRQSAASRLLDLAERRDQLDQLAGEIEAARKKMPAWTAGDVLLALVRCRAGRYDEARRLVPPGARKPQEGSDRLNVHVRMVRRLGSRLGAGKS